MKENWTYKKVKEVCDKASSSIVLNKIEDNTGEHPLYGASGLVKGIDFYHRDEPYIGIVKDGSGVGRVDVYPAKSSLVGTMQYILPKADVLLQYLCYALQGLKLSKFVMGAAIPHIYFKDYGECTIPVPPIETQSRIVSELDLLQSIIDKQQAQLKELDKLAQAVFYDMFGDPVENEKGWEVKRLEEIVAEDCPISYGIVQPGEGVANGVPVVRPVNMTNTFVFRFGLNQTTKEISDSYRRTILKGNEILLCVRGTTGLVALASEELVGCNVTRGIAPIECNEHNDRWFVYYQFLTKGIQQYIADFTKGIALKQINMKDVREIPFIVPPLSLQQSFATKIESIEKQKSAISQSIAETQKLFDYTMDKYFG
ncbi:MAG: restriction endonuclease subunit S [Bacteroidales bacterium]|nr:restriction endonuclease subunit S [Bacteroidales bacterium]